MPTLLISLTVALACAGCSSSGRSPDAADRMFLQDMIPHHQRAIAVARIGIEKAHDPRVEAFARRIVREQSPELASMHTRVRSDHLHLDEAAGATMAVHRISDSQVTELRRLSGHAFDVAFLQLNISSEQGAAQMARAEVSDGNDTTAVTTARGIASAPRTEIPELQKLLHALQ